MNIRYPIYEGVYRILTIKQPQPTFAVSKPDSSNYDPSN